MKARFFISVLSGLLFIRLSAGGSIYQQIPSSDDSLKIIEKVYLHVDRDSYNAGDDIWFKAYLIDSETRLLTDHSSNLHVELISPSSGIISSRVLRMEGGLGNGDFKLPAGIRPGDYQIRAYTNYMRNFSDQLFFTKEIAIANSSAPEIAQEEVKNIENQIHLSFFPEGGSLVDNVSSNVAFKAENSIGKGCDVCGKIFSSKGELITKFKSSHLGMGSFFLRPLPGVTYYSVYRGADSIDYRSQLPASFKTGITFSVSLNQYNELVITTKTNSETLPVVSDGLILSFSVRNEILKSISLKLNSQVTSFMVPTYDLPDGILMLTLTVSKDLPLAERLVYIEHETPGIIQIETDKPIYKSRETVNLKVLLPGDSTIERTCSVSLAAVNENLISNSSHYPRNISSWFLLESDIRGPVEDPSYYFDPSEPGRLKNLDLLLCTQGWRDFSWKYNIASFQPENGFTVSGALRKINKKMPPEGSRVSIGIFGNRNTFFKTVPVDSIGRFKLPGIDLAGDATLIVTSIGKKDRPEGLLTLDSLTFDPPEVYINKSVIYNLIESNQQKLRSYYKLNDDIKKKYKLTDTISVGEVHIISERHKDPQTLKVESSRLKYENPDAQLLVTEAMNSYLNVPELLRGKIPGLEVYGPKEGNYVIYFRGISTSHGETRPLVLIDGNKVDFNLMIWLPISTIDRIDVLKRVSSTVVFGLEGANGVINIITKAGGVPGDYIPPDYSVTHRISGYSVPRIFYSPQHSPDSDSNPNPDLRSTLYWKPDINLEGVKEVVLKYYNGDNSSFVRITAEGITNTGIPVTGSAEYEVK